MLHVKTQNARSKSWPKDWTRARLRSLVNSWDPSPENFHARTRWYMRRLHLQMLIDCDEQNKMWNQEWFCTTTVIAQTTIVFITSIYHVPKTHRDTNTKHKTTTSFHHLGTMSGHESEIIEGVDESSVVLPVPTIFANVMKTKTFTYNNLHGDHNGFLACMSTSEFT